MKNVVVAFLLIITGQMESQAQTLAELVKLPKDTLVRMAMAKLEKDADWFADFDRVAIWSYPTINRLNVEFERRVNFIGAEGKYINAVYVDLVSGSSGSMSGGLDIEEHDQRKYYVYTKAQKKQIEFVLKALRKHEGFGKMLSSDLENGNISIREQKGYYDVHIEPSQAEYHDLKVSKRSGKISDIRRTNLTLDDSGVKRIRVY